MHASRTIHRVVIFAVIVGNLSHLGTFPLTAKEVGAPENPDKHRFENFLVSIITGHDKDGGIIPPYLIVTEQRFIGEVELPYACLSNNTSEILLATLLASQTSSILIGKNKVTIIRNTYQFKPPAKQYMLRQESFDNLKNSYPFRGFTIDTDGKRIHGNVGPLQELPTS